MMCTPPQPLLLAFTLSPGAEMRGSLSNLLPQGVTFDDSQFYQYPHSLIRLIITIESITTLPQERRATKLTMLSKLKTAKV